MMSGIARLFKELHRQRPVLFYSLVCHCLLLLLLAGSSLIQSWRRPPRQVFEVIEVGLPLVRNPAPDTPANPAEPEPESTPVQPPAQQPDPPPPPTLPDPPPREPERPRWQPRTADEIRAQAALQPVTPRNNPPPPRPPPTTAQNQPTPRAEDIADRARQQVARQNLTVIVPERTGPTGGSPTDINRYGGALMTLLQREWQQPSATSVPNHQRSTIVTLTIAGNGTISNARLRSTSGSQTMDQSVLAIFQRLRQVPAPNRYNIASDPLIIDVTFELD